MSHEVLWSVLDAQRANATLSGSELRAAAERLADIGVRQQMVLMAFDATGERILGAMLALTSVNLAVYDYTSEFPENSACLLVGGYVAGPIGIADAAAAASGAGAARVEAAILGGWRDSVQGVTCIRDLGDAQAQVA